jgi:diacylglycerol kinase (ATP)
MKTFLKSRVDSLKYALTGLRDIVRTEHNARIHAFCTVVTLGLAAWLEIEGARLVLVVLAIALVWIAEAFNTVFELVVNIVSPEYCETARRAKDLAATAVLFAAMAAFITGFVIILPPFLAKFGL